MLHQGTSTPVPVERPDDVQESATNVTDSDVIELEQMQRDVVRMEKLVERKKRALDELKQIHSEEKKLRKEMRVSLLC